MHEVSGLSRRGLVFSAAGLGLAALARPAMAATDYGATPLAVAKDALSRVGYRIAHHDVAAVADFSPASREARLHLVDMASGETQSLLVAHGRGSDPSHTGWLTRFSNVPGSDCTSEGAYRTGDYYIGEHGRSMRLQGLDYSNDNAEARGIVVHSAWYVGADMIRTHGMLGRSEGCFAVSPEDLETVLERLGPGRLLVATRL
jgi:hypothetical protein